MIEGVLTTAFAVTETDERDIEVCIEPVPVQGILLSLSLVFAPQARSLGLRFSVLPSSALVSTDRRILMRIMNNLVTNAMRYTQNGQVLVGCRRRADGIGLQVLDTGQSMTAAEVATATLPYIQHTKETAGHGLGLATCQRLCARIGAELLVSSIKGRGTVVEVFLRDNRG